MFTGIAWMLMLAIVWLANRANQKDAPTLDPRGHMDMARFARQDLRLIAWLLAAILVALGVIADRLH